MAQSTPSTSFPDLPNEIHYQILSYLSYQEILPLRATCHTLSNLVPFSHLKRLRQTLKTTLLTNERSEHTEQQRKFANFLLWARAFPHEYRSYTSSDTTSNIHANFITKATYLNCYACLERLPRECFTDAQATGSRSLGHKKGKYRFCKRCGVEKGIWELGTVVKEAKRSWIVCKACRTMRQVGASGYKREGVCSAECEEQVALARSAEECVRVLGAVSLEDGSAPDLDAGAAEIKHNPIGLNATPEFLDGATSIRASRCLRCWAFDHTKKSADGTVGMGLCKCCEGFVDNESTEINRAEILA